MAERKVYLRVVMSLQMTVDDGVEIASVMDNMNWIAEDNDAVATIEDFTMASYDIVDSK